jgi:hypothetical protein
MKKMILMSILLLAGLVSSYAQSKPPKYLCQKWRADTTAFRELLTKEFSAKTPNDKADEKMMKIFLESMLQEIGQMWFSFAENGICTMGTPREIEKGNWQFEASSQMLIIKNPEKNQETQFLVKELKAKRLILSEKNGDKYSQNITFKAE